MRTPAEYIEYRITRIKNGYFVRDFVDLLVYIAKAYLMVIALMVILQRSFMYYPARDWVINPTDNGIQVVNYMTADKVSLYSWYVPPKSDKPVFVMFHGNGGNISHRVSKMDYFTKRGYGFLLAEYRGYGKNDGEPNEYGLYDDGRAAIDWLKNTQHIDESRIIIYGESLGTGVASEMALEYKKAKALVLEAPFTSMINEAGETYPWLGPFKQLTFDRYNNLTKAPFFVMPTLIVSGDHDSVVPHRHSEELIDAVGSKHKKLVTVEGGDHNNLISFNLLPIIQSFVGML